MLMRKINSRLTSRDATQKVLDLIKGSSPYEGKVSENRFKIYKRLPMFVRNSFLPIFVGEIDNMQGGCLIKIKARPNLFSSIFFSIWMLGGIVIPLIIGLFQPIMLLASLGFAILLILLFLFAFYLPSKNTMDYLEIYLS